ncbi:uracil phosphoribosyltransferase [Legionella israelensis]|uniref:Uracil phosphoribosyltransferase n=1 Tax=Legionella israelensis TaxID=454 RepID=A0A0W0WJJ6_9GAMM|nr:uracil phosphoribosyltransferase [Legionella israelensis]KTD32480.1 uracil phosphoribosyltransferase [Legionella israelensis]QBS10214.1 uracil phosphoribosyltransferase [Legionella israelensis]SCY32665.1 uracil phosphoribosyltransferase [Legionella israelensis DSM 19235]STX59807.1 uracil phosphoribosyltransferase [Legionella israelensis]
MSTNIIEVKHPLIQHKLTIMRKKETSSAKFRTLLHEISMLLTYEITRDLELDFEDIETPLASMSAPVLKGEKPIFVSILRAGNGLLNGMLELIPTARVGHIGLYRDTKTAMVVEYYFKLPEHIENRDIIVVDPMLATGHTAVAAVNRIKEVKPKSIKFLCLLAAPEGLSTFQEMHPEVPVYTAAIDEKLNEKSYILPGLGDAGDRIYGTKMDN